MRTLIVIDRKGWAYDRIAQAIQKKMPCDILAVKDDLKKIKKQYKNYDRFLVMGWQCYEHVRFLPKSETLTGVHGHHAWDGKMTMPDQDIKPPIDLVRLLGTFRGVNVVSERLHRLFPFAHYTPNGVDTEVFRRIVLPGSGRDFIVGCAYNPKHDWRKGVMDYIVPACKAAGVDFNFAPKNKKLEEMIAYYNMIDLYVCASSSEGMSLSVLEALGCGRPLVTTWSDEVFNSVHPGVVCARNVDAIAEAIVEIKEGSVRKLSDRIVSGIENWSWEVRAKEWVSFIKS